MDDTLHDEVTAIILKYAGRREFDEDAFLGQDLDILGGDCVEFLDELENRFGVDLRPLVERGPLERNTIFHRMFGVMPRRSGVDITARQLIDYIREQSQPRDKDQPAASS